MDASTAQAALALKSPDGQCSIPEPSLRSRIASSTTADTVVGVEEGDFAVAIGDEGVVAVGGEQGGAGIIQLRAAHDETMSGVGGFADPGLAVHRVVDRCPVLLADRLDSPLND